MRKNVRRSIKVFSIVGFLALAPAVLTSAVAQDEQKSAEEKLETADHRVEAVAVMRAAVEYVYRKELDRDSEYLTKHVKIDPTGLK